jgi:hypothetical protein
MASPLYVFAVKTTLPVVSSSCRESREADSRAWNRRHRAMWRSRFVINGRLALPRCSGKSPLRSIPLHRTYARALSGGRAACQAGSCPLPLDCASGILGRAARIPGEVSGLWGSRTWPQTRFSHVEFGRKAVVAQVIVEAYRPSAAVAVPFSHHRTFRYSRPNRSKKSAFPSAVGYGLIP